MNEKISQEDLRVLRECDREGFFKRSLPLATLFGVITSSAIKSGFIRSNPRSGSASKICVGVIIGFLLGKISYLKICEERLMGLPNSEIGKILRQRNNKFNYMDETQIQKSENDENRAFETKPQIIYEDFYQPTLSTFDTSPNVHDDTNSEKTNSSLHKNKYGDEIY